MGAINRLPRGYLGLLSAKTMGNTPDRLSDELRSIIDLTEFYRADVPPAVEFTTQAGVTAAGSVAAVDVPDGELWFIYAISSQGTLAVGTSLTNFGPEIAINGTERCRLQGITTNLSTVGQFTCASWESANPLLLSSGNSLATWIGSIGGTLTVTTSVLVRRVLI